MTENKEHTTKPKGDLNIQRTLGGISPGTCHDPSDVQVLETANSLYQEGILSSKGAGKNT